MLYWDVLNFVSSKRSFEANISFTISSRSDNSAPIQSKFTLTSFKLFCKRLGYEALGSKYTIGLSYNSHLRKVERIHQSPSVFFSDFSSTRYITIPSDERFFFSSAAMYQSSSSSASSPPGGPALKTLDEHAILDHSSTLNWLTRHGYFAYYIIVSHTVRQVENVRGMAGIIYLLTQASPSLFTI